MLRYYLEIRVSRDAITYNLSFDKHVFFAGYVLSVVSRNVCIRFLLIVVLFSNGSVV